MAKPADCIVAHYDCEEAAASGLIDSVGSLDLARAAGSGNIASVAGRVGNGRHLEYDTLNNDHFDVANSAITQMSNAYTWGVIFWVNLESKAASAHFLSCRVVNLDWWVRYNTGVDRHEFTVWTTGGANTDVRANNFGSPGTGAWQMIAAWFDHTGPTINISVNAGTANSAAHAGNINATSTTFDIGSYGATGGSGESLDGTIDEISIFKNGFPSEYLADIYNGGSGISRSQLLAIGQSSVGFWSPALSPGRCPAVPPYDTSRQRSRH